MPGSPCKEIRSVTLFLFKITYSGKVIKYFTSGPRSPFGPTGPSLPGGPGSPLAPSSPLSPFKPSVILQGAQSPFFEKEKNGILEKVRNSRFKTLKISLNLTNLVLL